VRDNDQWSLDVYNLLKRPVHQFDCTVDHAAAPCPECHFFQVCVEATSGAGAVAGRTNWALKKVLDESGLGHAPNRSLVMKMDIEGSEWPILAEMGPGAGGDVLKKFKQLILEFHWMDKTENHAQYLQAMQNLAAAGFRVAHVHGNNWRGMYREGGYSVPNVVEVTFVSEGQPLATCHDPERSVLDNVNNPNNPIDLPEAKLP